MIKDENRYLDYLKENDVMNMSSIISEMLDEESEENLLNKTVHRTTLLAVGPILISYVLWVLEQAERQNVKRLYFLARDGLIMYEIAKKLALELELDIELKYFYCSRKSLRSVISFIDYEEGLEQLACYSTNTTMNVVFNRMNFEKIEIDSVMKEMGLSQVNLDSRLNVNELSDFRAKLSKCQHVADLLNQKSRLAYSTCIEYFRQEGLLDEEKIAFVDSGWSGSMQKNFRIILEHYFERKCNLIGFYFGITAKTNNENGVYNGFYLNSKTSSERLYKFNNNLFEIFCSANHGMTIGYERNGEKIIPSLAKYNEKWPVDLQIHIVKELVTKASASIKEIWKSSIRLDDFVEPLAMMIMYDPLEREIKSYGNMMFDDDLSENNLVPLAKNYSFKDYCENFIFTKVLRKITGSINNNCRDSLWQYGSINAVESRFIRGYLRVNDKMWHLLKARYRELKKG